MKKKFILLFITILILFLLPGCGEKKISNNAYLDGEKVKGLNESQIKQKIKTMAIKKNKSHENAELNEDNWEIIKEENKGIKLNEEKTLESILKAKDDENIKYIFETINSKITARQLNENIKEIGRYSTIILDQKESRLNNIEVAIDYLNNVKVLQGEVFSFNETLGKRTKGKGYEKAPIIIKTPKGAKKADGIGGGICQISSTLYNAAKFAGMEIIERHPHSKKVGYVPLGEDATVSFGFNDFKFKNIKDIPIMIKVQIKNDKLIVRILGNYNNTYSS